MEHLLLADAEWITSFIDEIELLDHHGVATTSDSDQD
jgi:hypothetical protein